VVTLLGYLRQNEQKSHTLRQGCRLSRFFKIVNTTSVITQSPPLMIT
jgi:hypothetical protein